MREDRQDTTPEGSTPEVRRWALELASRVAIRDGGDPVQLASRFVAFVTGQPVKDLSVSSSTSDVSVSTRA